jgi:uncharacterized membrane protein
MACSGPAAPGLKTNDGLSASAGSAASSETSWCEIQPILRQKCQRCHQLPAEHGAPFSLLTYADTQAGDGKGNSRFQLMAAVIDSKYMPPQFIELDPPVEPLTAEERASLLAWCSQGATLNESDSCSGNQ